MSADFSNIPIHQARHKVKWLRDNVESIKRKRARLDEAIERRLIAISKLEARLAMETQEAPCPSTST